MYSWIFTYIDFDHQGLRGFLNGMFYLKMTKYYGDIMKLQFIDWLKIFRNNNLSLDKFTVNLKNLFWIVWVLLEALQI